MAGNITSRTGKQITANVQSSGQFSLSSLYSPGSPTQEMDPITITLGFPTFINASKRCVQRCFSQMILDSVKLTIKSNHSDML